MDAGALGAEFFESLLQHTDENLFKCREGSRVPKKDSNLQRLLESAGLTIAHSIVHGGPAYSCSCPAVFNYMLYLDEEQTLVHCPTVEVNASTCGVIKLTQF